MNHYYTRFATVMAVCLCMAGCSSNETQSTQQTPPSAAVEDPLTKGRIVFENNCTICHGADGTAGIANAANLQTSKLDSIAVIQTISDGKKTMPGFKSQLSKEEIENLAAYITTLRK